MKLLQRTLIALLSVCVPSGAFALTYTLASGNESWPAAKRAAIISAMDEAVALYNQNGYFPKTLWANYNASVPTAQGSYSGWIDFGGSISTRVALHEISHTLGVGQYSTWSTNQSGGHWTGSYALARVKLFDGSSATIGCDSMHFWPYGLNYDNEDSTTNRVRHIKMVSALRRDMGIVADSDGDGMPDDWEIFNFGNLSQTASGDYDGDGATNLAEYQADTDPVMDMLWTGATSSDWATASNWSSVPAPAPSNVTQPLRVNVNNNAGFPLIYSAAQGTTVYANAGGRGIVIGSGSNNANTSGSMTIAGGSFSTVGSGFVDVVGNNAGNSGTLVVDGGSFSSTDLTLGNGGGGTGTLTIQSGTATINTFAFNFLSSGTGTVNLDGGTFAVDAVAEISTTGNHTFNFNGGKLKATADGTAFMQNLTNAFVKAGGAVIDTGANDITIAQNLLADAGSPGGGLSKSGTGTLTLAGSNSFTGAVTVSAGGLRITRTDGLGTGTKTVTLSNGTAGLCRLILAGTGGNISLPAGISFLTSNQNTTYPAIINEAGGNTIAGNFTMTNGGGATRIRVDAGTLTLSGNFTPNLTGRALQLDGTGNGTFSGNLLNGTGSNIPALSKDGPGTWTLTGTGHTFTGNTTVNAGTLKINVPFFADNSTITVATGAKLNLNFSGTDTVGSLVLGGTTMGAGTLSAATHPAFLAGTGAVRIFGATPFADWMGASFPGQTDPAIVGPAADPDRDGIPNLMEFALNTSPTAPSRFTPTLVASGASIEFIYARNRTAAGVTFHVEWSDSLAEGSWSTAGVTESAVVPEPNPDPSLQTFKAIVPVGSGGKCFVRLRVTQP